MVAGLGEIGNSRAGSLREEWRKNGEKAWDELKKKKERKEINKIFKLV